MPSVRVISIGCLPAHPLWNERQPVRVGHATTTLISTGDRLILVDPGLPPDTLAQRLAERANLKPADITTVFLTTFRPDTHRALPLFDDADWFISRAEREAVGVPMASALRHALETGKQDLIDAIQHDVALLARCREAPDSLAESVDLFPLPGVSPGCTGLLIEHADDRTTLICGDAVPTLEHIEQGKVLPWAADLKAAKASFAEALEIADDLIPGRDNILPSPGARPMAEPEGTGH
jgi:glyoxylase-like metal-dependent hydrolase (beta-lactamase superfamily II)